MRYRYSIDEDGSRSVFDESVPARFPSLVALMLEFKDSDLATALPASAHYSVRCQTVHDSPLGKLLKVYSEKRMRMGEVFVLLMQILLLVPPSFSDDPDEAYREAFVRMLEDMSKVRQFGEVIYSYERSRNLPLSGDDFELSHLPTLHAGNTSVPLSIC